MEMNLPITWQSFKEQLRAYSDLELQFQYAENKWVDASYHITEIKQAPIVSVDCGGNLNSWTEIIVQLWEPGEMQQERAMKAGKALTIVDMVEKALPLDPAGTVKIEFGNSRFHTRQMFPGTISAVGGNLVVDLRPDVTQCKAIDRGGSCGTTDNVDECCAPAEKPTAGLINLAVAGAICTPGSGCC